MAGSENMLTEDAMRGFRFGLITFVTSKLKFLEVKIGCNAVGTDDEAESGECEVWL